MATPAERNAVSGLLDANVANLAQLWRIQRRDGVRHEFTNHNQPITFEGVTYSPVMAGDASAIRSESGLKDSTRNYSGFIDSDQIKHEDLLAGRYDEAVLTETVVDWRYPWAGALLISRAWLTRPTFDKEQWSVEVEGVTRFLRDARGRTFSTTCDYDLGDNRCQKDISADTVYDGTVNAAFSDADGIVNRQIFTADGTGVGGQSLSGTDDFYTHGRLVWATGLNAGFISEVKAYNGTTKDFELKNPTKFDITLADEFLIEPGCNKLKQTCIDKFDNLVFFGGFPFLPGADKLLKQPVKAS